LILPKQRFVSKYIVADITRCAVCRKHNLKFIIPVVGMKNQISNRIFSTEKDNKIPIEDKVSGNEKDHISTSNTGKHGVGIGSTFEYANVTYHEFERKLMAQIKESNQRRFRVVLVSLIVLVTWVIALFGDQLRKVLTDKTAGFAKETLENESLKIQTQELAMAVVQTVLNDQETTNHAAAFLKEAATAAATQQALVDLAVHIVQHPDTLHHLTILAKKLLEDVASDPESLQRLVELGVKVLQDEALQRAAGLLVVELSRDPAVLQALSELAVKVLAARDVSAAVNELVTKTSVEVLRDEEIVARSRGFVSDVVGDAALQKEGGNALWHSVTYALQPGIIRITGFGLVCVSVAVLKLFLSPY